MKRTLDLAIAAVGIVVLSPLLFASFLAIALASGRPVIYQQVRVGRHGRSFGMLKFRTMRRGAHAEREELAELNERTGGLFKIRDDPRLTRVGRIMRRASLDELPQLLNVLRGEMSIVGPRPLIPEEDRLVTGDSRQRLDLRPGMTGYWQVKSSENPSLEEMLELDRRYADEWSPLLDLRLLVRTMRLVLARRGV